jgi:alginate O-acetyltransferase complex protein AlgI
MLFNSFQYLQFLPVVLILYWLVKKSMRPIVLLLASYYFYMSWFPAYGLLLGVLTLANYLVGLTIAKCHRQPEARKAALLAGLAINLGCLAYFKYANFLAESIVGFLRTAAGELGVSGCEQMTAPHWNIILPLGISFFVFEFIHYLTDVYAGNEPIRSPQRFALFAAFFPSQIAGPIKRFEDFDSQILEEKTFNWLRVQNGLALILEGMFKKVALGDNLAILVQTGFHCVDLLSRFDAWFCMVAFTLQIYYDFSGYTDIGRGSALLFGIELPENFNKPYLSASLVEFWRRWHMSLSFWLRDYLYKPLGGSRGGIKKQHRNLLITMLLGGLWHGASWHYVLWGLLHGLGLVANHAWNGMFSERPRYLAVVNSVGGRSVAIVLTGLFVLMGWVLFRAESLEQAMAMYDRMFFYHAKAINSGFLFESFKATSLAIAFMLYALFQGMRAWIRMPRQEVVADEAEPFSLKEFLLRSAFAQIVTALGVALIILSLSGRTAAPFIYFQF